MIPIASHSTPLRRRADREEALGGQALGVEQRAVLGDVEAEAELVGTGSPGREQAGEDRRGLGAQVATRAAAVDHPVDLDRLEFMRPGVPQGDPSAAAVGLQRDDRVGPGDRSARRPERVEAIGDVGRHPEAVDVPEALELGEEAPLLGGVEALPERGVTGRIESITSRQSSPCRETRQIWAKIAARIGSNPPVSVGSWKRRRLVRLRR